MFPGYKSTMLSCGYEIKKDVVLGEKLGAILSVSYIRQKSFKGKYHIILLLDKELNLNPAIVTFLFGVFLCLSQLFVDRSLYSSKICTLFLLWCSFIFVPFSSIIASKLQNQIEVKCKLD